jgi:hypothetical protein
MFDIKLEKVALESTDKSHYPQILEYKNTIAWMCHSVPQEEQKKRVNMLFFENGLLDRGRTYYLDDNGYGRYSNVVLRRYNTQPCSDEEVAAINLRLEKAKWKKPEKITKDRVVMIALQSKYGEDKKMLEKCETFLPKDAKVIIREHQARRKDAQKNYGYLCERNKQWEFDFIEDAFESLHRCSALVVNTSSMMYKGLYCGIPVAACDRGFNGESAAVLDCSRNPSLLSNIFDFKFNQEATNRLLCGIDKSSISGNAMLCDVLQNTSFGNWLRRFKW